jgi:hypothetical protein
MIWFGCSAMARPRSSREFNVLGKVLVAFRFSTNLVIESLRHPGKGFVISTDTGEVESRSD